MNSGIVALRAVALPSAAVARRASDSIVWTLVDRGVDTFFGIPGGPVSPVFDAILGNPGARLVESRHETGAAFAAAGYYRASGKVPCLVVTAGPGITNAMTGVASAFLEGIPLVVLSGDVSWASGGRRLIQDCGPEGLDVEAMFRSVTKSCLRLPSARSASPYVAAALSEAVSGRPGPVLLVVPIQESSSSGQCPSLSIGHSPPMPLPPPRSVEEACLGLAAAKRPLIVVGGACRGLESLVQSLAESLAIPFLTTPRAKGLISERHLLSLRNGGIAASAWARAYTALGVDYCLALGTDLDDCSVGGLEYVAEGGSLMHVDVDPRVFGRNVRTTSGVVCDVGAFLSRAVSFASGMEDVRLDSSCVSDLMTVKACPAFNVPDFSSGESLAPFRALADLQSAAPGARFVTDIGEHMLFALHYLTAGDPDAFTINLGLGSMGSGIGSAVGLALGDPSRPVVCVCGDGGMQMGGMEVLVAVRERLPVVFAVFNDGRYNMVYHGHKQVYGREAPWDSPMVDFCAWAKSVGVPSRLVERPGEIDGELLRSLGSGPCVLDIRIDPSVRMVGGGRNEALLNMSVPSSAAVVPK